MSSWLTNLDDIDSSLNALNLEMSLACDDNVEETESSTNEAMILESKKQATIDNEDNKSVIDSLIIQALSTGSKKEKEFLVNIDRDLINLMDNPRCSQRTFNDLSNRHRLLLHRLADRFKLGHTVISDESTVSTRSMVIFKKKGSFLPKNTVVEVFDKLAIQGELSLDGVPVVSMPAPAPKKVMLMKRKPTPTGSTKQAPTGNQNNVSINSQAHHSEISSSGNASSPSVVASCKNENDPKNELLMKAEDKEKAYAAARARIFATGGGSESATLASQETTTNGVNDKIGGSAKTAGVDSNTINSDTSKVYGYMSTFEAAAEDAAEFDRRNINFSRSGGRYNNNNNNNSINHHNYSNGMNRSIPYQHHQYPSGNVMMHPVGMVGGYAGYTNQLPRGVGGGHSPYHNHNHHVNPYSNSNMMYPEQSNRRMRQDPGRNRGVNAHTYFQHSYTPPMAGPAFVSSGVVGMRNVESYTPNPSDYTVTPSIHARPPNMIPGPPMSFPSNTHNPMSIPSPGAASTNSIVASLHDNAAHTKVKTRYVNNNNRNNRNNINRNNKNNNYRNNNSRSNYHKKGSTKNCSHKNIGVKSLKSRGVNKIAERTVKLSSDEDFPALGSK